MPESAAVRFTSRSNIPASRGPASETEGATRACVEPPHQLLDLGACKLAYWSYGRGPDLVLVHGWPLSSATFRDVVPRLAPHYRCHLFDLPGAGASVQAEKAMIDLRVHVDTLQAALARLGVRDYALLGHDSGAAVARMLAARDSGVRSLVISGSEIPGHHPRQLQLFVWLAQHGLSSLLWAPLQLAAVRRSALGYGACFHDVRHVDGDFHTLLVAPTLRSAALRRGATALLQSFDWSVVDGLRQVHGQIHAPTLLLWGEGDPYFPVEKARAMTSQFAGPTEFVSVPRARLFVHEEHPRTFAEHVLRFLQAHATSSQGTHA